MAVGRSVAVFVSLVGLVPSAGATAQDEPYVQAYPIEARVWLDRGAEAPVQPGDRVRVYYRVSEDAFVAVFQIDANGTVRLVYPRSPEENHYVRGGRDYRLLFPRSPYWYVDDHPGVGYFFVVASPTPFDFSAFGYSHYDGGWDLSRVGRTVYSDPYLAIDDYVSWLIPDWEYAAYGLDIVEYDVGQAYDYPRFLCYECHGFQPYYAWNPYYSSCTSFRVVVFTDPFYYPTRRYRGDRVVFVRPPSQRQPRFVFKERAEGEPGTPEFRTRPVGLPGVEGDVDRRRVDGDPDARGPRALPGRTPEDRGAGVERSGETRIDTGSRVRPPGRPSELLPGSGSRGEIGRDRGEPRSATPGRTGPPGASGEPTRPTLERRDPGEGRLPEVIRPRGERPAVRGGAPGERPAIRIRPTEPPSSGRPQVRPSPRPGSRPDAAPGRPARDSSRPQARPAPRPSGPPPSARPGVGSSGSRGGARPSARPTPRPPPRPSTGPARPSGPSSRPSARPSPRPKPPPRPSAGSGRPSPRPSARPSPRPKPPPRPSAGSNRPPPRPSARPPSRPSRPPPKRPPPA